MSDFNSIFGNGNSNGSGVTMNNSTAPRQGSRQGDDRNTESPKLWLNVGKRVGEGEDTKFVSLPVGIALDTQKPAELRGNNEEFREFTKARNDLLALLQDAASKLAPGEERFITLDIQLRRVNEERAAPETSRFAIDASAIGLA